ncbi:hypothetical protein KUTeg_009336 [Tegillarca granosa]|uniref:phosphatidylserine decarboxylase n=1 Tax=Tegillarca granosa TaxID=220873 RepID=A0ABQ9F3J2_TEGGR|nr:hypothetical protein KUTeg_009336 [Tegillarca granosa]
MIVLFWGMFLTTPTLGVAEDFDQTVLYSSLILAVLLTGRHTTTKGFLKNAFQMSRWKVWEKIAKMDPREIIFYGLRLGIPLKQLQEFVSSRKLLMKKKTRKYKRHTKGKKKQLNNTIELYRKMPLKAMSRAWGKFNQFDLPVLLRRPLLGLYIWMFGCKLEEASDEELRNYKNLGEFFRRTLKPHVRKIDKKHPLTSPADGKILHYGVVKDGILEQVKGVVYSLRGFLGPLSWMNNTEDVNRMTDQEYYNKMNIKPGHKLYHCVIYLSPGDYHRFHSASDWTINYRRHFPGELLSVSPGVARWIQGLFNFNERVVYTGSWKHGFFSYTAVGATNVGSIKIYCDQKGEMFGEFNLGSTIVLIFEAPDNFKFEISQGQKVKFGQPFGLSN